MKPSAEKQGQVLHDPKFSSVCWFGRQYAFSPPQAKCIKALWNFWLLGTPVIREQMVLDIAKIKVRCLKDVFESEPGRAAWGTMIRDGDRRGTVRLIEPTP